MNKIVLFVLAVSSLRSSIGDEIRVRGLHPSNKKFYRSQNDFTCFDGSATIPFSLVNDDYCDCKDGSDEPGTSACPNGRFYCVNKGHRSFNLLSSRVNDKICDCCDGSDEWGTEVACPNTCEEMGKRAQEKQRQQQELHAQGHTKRQDYAAQGKQKEKDSQALLAQKEAELEVMRREVEQLATVKDAAEEPENVAKEKHRHKYEEEQEAKRVAARRADAQFGFDELDTNSDGFVSVEELRTRYELDDDSDGDVSEEEALGYLNDQVSINFDTFFSDVWDKIADKCRFRRPPPQIDPPESIRASDTDPSKEESYEEEEDDDEDEEEDDDNFDDDDHDDVHPVEEMPEYDEKTKELIAVADAARAAHREVDSKKSGIEREIADLKKFLEIDYGVEREFSSMYNQCYEFTDREYTYKMCAFDKVTQAPKGGGRETNLGTWGKWNGPPNNIHSVMLYEDGEKCWNGPSRSATITIVCGLEDKLLSASEPNRCEYAMDFSTPAVCIPITHELHEEL